MIKLDGVFRKGRLLFELYLQLHESFPAAMEDFGSVICEAILHLGHVPVDRDRKRLGIKRLPDWRIEIRSVRLIL